MYECFFKTCCKLALWQLEGALTCAVTNIIFLVIKQRHEICFFYVVQPISFWQFFWKWKTAKTYHQNSWFTQAIDFLVISFKDKIAGIKIWKISFQSSKLFNKRYVLSAVCISYDLVRNTQLLCWKCDQVRAHLQRLHSGLSSVT